MIVVDTTVIAYLMIPGPFSPLAEAALEKDRWCAPLLWRSEFRSVLAVQIRSARMTIEDARTQMRFAERIFLNNEFSVRSEAIFDCIKLSNRSAYDCEFVALARELGLILVTTDEGILTDFSPTAIHLRDYVSLPR